MALPQQRLFSNKRLVMLIAPLILEQSLGFLVGMVDGVIVSSVSEAAMSGVSLVANIAGVILTLFTAMTSGGAVVTSQFLGARKKESARHSAGQLVTLSTGVAVALMIICLLFSKGMLRACFGNVEQDVMDAAVEYFRYSAYSYPFIAIYNAFVAILRANGDSKTSFFVSMLKNVINLIGNMICIYGLGMGVEGVAIPTLLARVIGAVVIMLIAMNKRQPLRPKVADFIRIDGKLIKRILRIGMPSALENSLFQLGRVVTLGMITAFGTYQIAANSTASSLVNIVLTSISAFRIASLTVIGQCVGARDMAQIKENFRKLIGWSYLVHGVIAAAFIVFRHPIISVYRNLSPETVELTAELMCIHLFSAILLYPLAFFINGPLRATNDSSFPMWISIFSMGVFRLGLAQILCVKLGWGAAGVWWAMVADWVFRSVCFTARWCSGAWKKKCGMHEKSMISE